MWKTCIPIVVLILAATAIIDGGCGGNSATPSLTPTPIHTPTPTPTHWPIRMYVASDQVIYVYDLPLTTISIPAATFADTSFGFGVYGLAFDPTHRLFVSYVIDFQAYNQPIANGASPAFTVGSNAGPNTTAFALDAAGDVFVRHGMFRCRTKPPQCYYFNWVNVYMAPITGSSSSSYSFTAVGGDWARGMAFDPTGNLWLTNGGNGAVAEYAPPFSASSIPAMSFPTSDILGGFDSAGNMYAFGATGIDVYRPPFTSSTSAAFTINNAGAWPWGLAFDSAGNLYVIANGGGRMLVFSPPFNSASEPKVKLEIPNPEYFVAIGP